MDRPEGHREAKMSNFLAELKKRNVFKVATIYVVVSWLILQVTDIVFPVFEIPLWSARLVVILLGLGFPVALILAWAFDLTPEGIAWNSEVGEQHVHTHVWDWVLGILLVIAIGSIVTSEFRRWGESAPVATVLPDQSAPSQVATASQVSIAVLPFVNMSGDPENEYFSDGMSEEILNLLAKIPTLKVIGRTSSFAFKGRNEDLRDIGRTLDVSTILEGSVRKVGDNVRITAQLIDSSDASHIWSETYDRELTDVFAVQDDVAAAIIDALQIHVGVIPSRGRPTDSTDAYGNFLRAGIAAGQYDWRTVRQLCQRAVDFDPDFAEAHELLAYSAWRMAGIEMRSDEAMALMRSASESALAVDPDLVLARALYRSSDADSNTLLGEIQAFDEAAAEQPDDPRILDSLYFNLLIAGYVEEALDIAQRLAELDPLSPIANGRLPPALFAAGRVDDGFAALEIFDQLDQERTNWFYGDAALAFGRDSIAIASFRQTLSEDGVDAADWVADLVAGGRDPDTGQAYLDRRIPEIVASVPEDFYVDLGRELVGWYLYFGHLDRFFDIILNGEPTEAAWAEAGEFIATGIVYRQLGFTAHPRYLKIAKAIGIVNVWEQRGPPDFCERSGQSWICH
jgi:TolB-like protein/tetratricopeptide (TPR) repeat protein